MRALLTILGVVALVIVVAGAINRAIELRVDYLVGTTTAVSLFWFALGAAILLVAAGLLGLLAGRGSAAAARRKLETELEDTYQRLRGAQAAVLARAETPVAVVAPVAAEAETAVEPVEARTAIEAAGTDSRTAVETAAPEAQTVVVSAPAEPGTVVVQAPVQSEPETVVQETADELGTRAAAPPAEPPPDDPPRPA